MPTTPPASNQVMAVKRPEPPPISIRANAEHVKLLDSQLLSNNWYVLRKVTFELRRRDGSWQRQVREAYDRGNGAALLLFDPHRLTVVLTRQFRLPAFINGCADGYLIEACAGLLDGDDPETCIRKEAEEGNRLPHPRSAQGVRGLYEPWVSHRKTALLRGRVPGRRPDRRGWRLG